MADWTPRDTPDMRLANAPDAIEFSRTVLPLFGKVVALLAMKSGRAPLPVSANFLRAMVRSGFPNDVDEMTNFARRYLFLRDEWMLLAELKLHGATAPRIRTASTVCPKALPE